ncbi:hypothetical protein C3747_50g128 [Trypanosoma cruzi]|uniref:Ribonuclease H2 subunit B wHTH domain-containing protein n=3 Tax=Trypanosoma cruzi TaxID=5693 RepID=Q4D1N8_TRYCC|nr:hypothetical protein, conserved [Trypanosoma cruzi]AAF98142.1 unknown [Trypanosoma cruzi]EAN86441.1 hypothetical protein, conserved [Trypanosoma cruzi]PWV12578.1 hypothetical protein C3747_50g128 [Trypanosoma cruzi]|eukprot:XP_808292.1 hypothetical protein [Trypanosoma cruzi strain CL Brener]
MRATKRARMTSSLCTNKNNATTTANTNSSGRSKHGSTQDALRCGSHPSSCCSSDGGSPRRRLELDDEGSQSVSCGPMDVGAWTAGNVRYDASDHTVALPSNGLSRHMMVLPRVLLHDATTVITTANNNNNNNNDSNGCNNINRTTRHTACKYIEDGDIERSPSTTVDNAYLTHNASPRPAVHSSPALCDAPPSACEVSLFSGCDFVRLPHPRHGGPALFLCPPTIERKPGDVKDDSARVVLYEVQAQLPLGGFGQTWFVNDIVEPNEELLVVTPFDVTFLALRQVATHARKEMFVSPEDIIMGATKTRGGGSSEWPGWRVAMAQCPALTPVVEEMQSHTVLSRLCDVKSVGGDQYYRFSEERMGQWLREKVQRVANSPALRAILQIGPSPPTNTATTSIRGVHGGNDKTTALPTNTAIADVPLPVAFGVVAEYVVEEMSQTAARLCGSAS